MLNVALCMLATMPAHANGPAWIAELSDPSPAGSDSIEVTIPLGSHVALGVYNTDAVDPMPRRGVTLTSRRIWYEHRTVFVGMPEERDVSVPYYLPKPDDCSPTGSFVVEITPREVGRHRVRIKCNTNTVTATVNCVELPKSDIGYGFYTDMARYGDWTKEPEYNRDMAAHGMNTFTAYAREYPGNPSSLAPEALAYHMDLAIETGLLDKRFPVLSLSCGPPTFAEAKALAKHEWPELIGYAHDEPNLTHKEIVAKEADEWHAVGARCGTAIDGQYAEAVGGPLDIWVLHIGSPKRAFDLARKTKEFWLYNCSLRGTNAALHRYWTGVYTWALQPRVCLTWAYMHDHTSRIMPDGEWKLSRVYDKAAPDREGLPMPTVALEGMAEGIIDSRFLQELERRDTPEGRRYLHKLRRSVDVGFWRDGRNRSASDYPWDVPDVQVPEIDCVVVRAKVLALLREAEAIP